VALADHFIQRLGRRASASGWRGSVENKSAMF
jgi:hypothetical protein